MRGFRWPHFPWLQSRRMLAITGIVLALSIVIYYLDVRTPWQYSLWLLYVFPLLLTYELPNRKVFLGLPVLLTLLNLGGFYFDPKPNYTVAEVFNRALGVSIIWITAALMRLHKQSDLRLQQKVVDLNASNRELEQFAYVVSHDLREPLRTVGSFSELLAKREQTQLGAESRQFIAYILEGVIHMQKLIDSLLEISRIGRSRASLAWVDCNAVIDEARKSLHRLIEENQATLEVGPLPTVWAQESTLAQLFHNLIHNAVKFHGPDRPRVQIQAKPHNSYWLFSVRDNGIGIDPVNFDRIFLMFQRLHDKKPYTGSGIGLAVCKKIVEQHGGKIWVESVPGRGATFYFTLRTDQGGEHV